MGEHVEMHMPQAEQMEAAATLGGSAVMQSVEQTPASGISETQNDKRLEAVTIVQDSLWSHIARQMITERGL